MNGLTLLGTKQNSFKVLNTKESGFLVKEEGRAIAVFNNAKGQKIILATQNNNFLKTFTIRRSTE
jgi:hypothetical protein